MHLTRQTDYALRLMIYLAVAEQPLATISEVSGSFRMSRNHLMKIVHHLAQLGYLQTLRGKGGGIRLARRAQDIRIGDVVRDLEPAIPLIDCRNPPCPIAGSCRLVAMLERARSAFFETLGQYTLADVVAEPAPLRTMLLAEISQAGA